MELLEKGVNRKTGTVDCRAAVASSTGSEWLIIESDANVSKDKFRFNGKRDWLPTFCTLQTGYLNPTVP